MFRISPISHQRLKQRLIIKILQGRDNANRVLESAPVFKWVLAGDSSAAGYGNAFIHSYTSIITDTVKGIFQSAGIRFLATN
jgi:hypothetical protein